MRDMVEVDAAKFASPVHVSATTLLSIKHRLHYHNRIEFYGR